MGKYRRPKQNRQKSVISISRYTQKAWLRSYPSSDEEEWQEQTHPENVYDFVSTAFSVLEDNDYEVSDKELVRIVTLDEKYYDYIKEKGLEDTSQQRAQYAAYCQYTNKELFEMAQKAGLDKAYTLLTIPVVMIRKEISVQSTNFKLTNEQIDKLTNYLEKIHGKGNVFVFGNFVEISEIVNNKQKFFVNGNLYFEKGIRFDLTEYRKQRYDNAINVAFLGIPFLIKSPIKKMVWKMDEFERMFTSLKYVPDLLETFTQEEFEVFRIEAPNFDETDIYKEIVDTGNLNVIPMQVALYELDEVIQDLINNFI